jgi:WD40 repeat protein
MFTGEMFARITPILLTGALLTGCTIRPFLPFVACRGEPTGQQDSLAQAVLQVQPTSLYLPDLPGDLAPISANNLHQLSRLGTITIPDAHLDALAYSADGERLAVATRMKDATYAIHVLMQQAANRSVKIPQDAIVYELTWAERDLLAVSKQGIKMELWQTDQGVRLCNAEVANDAIDQIQFSPDSMQLAIASSGRTARLINLSNGRVEHVFVHQAPVAGVAYQPDGKAIATLSFDRKVYLWRLPDGQLLWSTPISDSLPTALAYSPAGNAIAVGGAPIHLLDVGDGGDLRELRGNRPITLQIEFTRSGDSVIASSNGRLEFWRVADGELLRRLVFSPEVLRFSLRPDGRILAINFKDSPEIQFWGVDQQ